MYIVDVDSFMTTNRYFHGFARHSDAVELLKGRPGYFLVRYSESQLREGYFAFNVNKGPYIVVVCRHTVDKSVQL